MSVTDWEKNWKYAFRTSISELGVQLQMTFQPKPRSAMQVMYAEIDANLKANLKDNLKANLKPT
jgi:hypothetical protein